MCSCITFLSHLTLNTLFCFVARKVQITNRPILLLLEKDKYPVIQYALIFDEVLAASHDDEDRKCSLLTSSPINIVM